jgi:signal transduction histidine kinase/CheY-like chemotaxis protein
VSDDSGRRDDTPKGVRIPGRPRSDENETRLIGKATTTVEVDTPTAALNTTKARIVVLQGTHTGRKYPLDETNDIGRGSSCTVQLEDSMVSRRHAIVQRREDGGWDLVDLGSRNGTLLNGRRITREPVRFGDRIQIGETVLLFSHVDPLEERILQRQKLEAIGRLGAGIAHDINNLLGGILMNAEYLAGLDATRTLRDPDVVESLSDLRAAASLGADLTRRILALARRGSGEHQQIDLSALVTESIELARRTFGRAIRIERAIMPGIHVRGDRAHLHQMCMNLFLNARDAMPEGGRLKVALAHATPAEIDSDMVAVAGHHATIVVQDDGIGMDAETRARIFEPFFTTKSADKGSGLGLSTVLDVVTAHGGTIDCASEPGHGTTFRIVLPALLATARPESHTPLALIRAQRLGQAQTATILVVDDEPVSRRSICRLLAREGHRTLAAADGREALEVFEKEPGIDLVLMDLDMPEVDGQQALEAMTKSRPKIPVIILTGFVEDQRRRELLDAGARSILMKPCDADSLRTSIATALQGGKAFEIVPSR